MVAKCSAEEEGPTLKQRFSNSDKDFISSWMLCENSLQLATAQLHHITSK